MSETVKDAPITDRELDDLERVGQDILQRYGAQTECDLPETRRTLRFVAEIKRLRSDEWLEAASIALWEYCGGRQTEILEILRKHRDGAA